MNRITLGALALLTLGVGACNELSPVNPPPEPAAASMQFKQGARYEYTSYHTSSDGTGAKVDTSERRRTWTLVNPSASAFGQSGVAVYVDSVFSVGGIFSVADTTYLQQRASNDVYRYGSIAPELDISGLPLLDIGKQWQHEAKLNATAANWFVAEMADTFQVPQMPLVNQLKIAITDSATGSEIVDYAINGTTYKATKTHHTLRIGFYALGIPLVGQVGLKTETLDRTTWMVPELGAIVREERQGKTVSIDYQGQGTSFAIPGYVSVMTKVIATGG